MSSEKKRVYVILLHMNSSKQTGFVIVILLIQEIQVISTLLYVKNFSFLDRNNNFLIGICKVFHTEVSYCKKALVFFLKKRKIY